MADPTFRDFAFAVMQGNTSSAAATLEALLGVSPSQAAVATEHFPARMAEPAFMPKAMGLRTAVTAGTDEQVGALLVECFGLGVAEREAAIATLRKRYPAA